MKKIGVLAALLVVALALLFTRQGEKRLILRDGDTRKVYGTWVVEEGTEFSLSFVHSVNKSPILDVFAVEGDHLRAVKTVYTGLGAGVESDLLPGETLSYDEKGQMVITGFSHSYPDLRLIVGTVSDHTLTIEGKTYSLTQLCGKNAGIIIEVKP